MDLPTPQAHQPIPSCPAWRQLSKGAGYQASAMAEKTWEELQKILVSWYMKWIAALFRLSQSKLGTPIDQPVYWFGGFSL